MDTVDTTDRAGQATPGEPGRVVRTPAGSPAPLRLEFDRLVPAAVDALWRTLTTSAESGRWIGTWSGDPDTGRIDFVMTAEGATEGQPVSVEACEPPRLLALVMPGPDRPWRLRVELEASGDAATRVCVTQELDEDEASVEIGAGWHYYLDRWVAVTLGLPVPEDFEDDYPEPASRHYAPGE